MITYLRENEPGIMGIVKTKLGNAVVSLGIGEGKYNVWRKKRREKQGVMMLIKKDQGVDNINYGKGCAEMRKVGVQREG